MAVPEAHGSSLAGDGADRRDAVHFYERDEELADNVATFIGEGLKAGGSAVAIATDEHRRLFVERLSAMQVYAEAARLAGTLAILDAAGTLAKLMVKGAPDPALFQRVVGGAIDGACRRGGQRAKLRVYGEMVDLLWRAANQRAAVALEEMWGQLARAHPFDLMCAYSMASFRAAPAAETLSTVCDAQGPEAGAPPEGGPTAVLLGAQLRAAEAELAHRKEVEQVLRQTVRALQTAQAAERRRAARAKQAADDLKETIRVNELFMGVLAHDLRAPLASIVTAGQLIKIREAGGDGRNAKALGRILSSGERMSGMIEQLLDFTRLRVGGGIQLDPRSADMASLVRQAVDELESNHPESAVEVTCAGDTCGAWDSDRLTQVLSNLVANALQHGSPDAGVRVLVDGRAPDVVQVQVHNMGTIPAALVPQVFDPLTGGQRRRDRSRALGLGLFITKRIAAAHGGDVQVASNENDGTTFTLSLPRSAVGASGETSLSVAAKQTERSRADRAREQLNLAAFAQSQLRQSEARFRLLVEAVKDYAIFMLDPSGRVITWNAGAQRIKGYDAREIIGQHFSKFYEAEEIRAGKCEHELEVAAREGRFEDEGWRLRKDGTRFWANVVITALRSENGELVGFAKVTRDLSDRRRLEQEQLRLGKAEEAIRLRDEFLSLAAHELKTPLTVLQLQLDTLGDRMDQSGHRTATKLQRASESSERLANLVESLLDASRIATGRFALALKEFDLVDCASRVIDALRPSADKARCELSLDGPEPVVGTWDRLRLEQALTNLLANAIKYGAGQPVRVAVRRGGDGVVIEVRDHGPGIPQSELARIFQRFERAASIRNYGGLGLGLYLIRAIADAHGGTVTACNAADGGACFELKLPLRPVVPLPEDLSSAAGAN